VARTACWGDGKYVESGRGVRNPDSLRQRVSDTRGSDFVVPRGNRDQPIADHLDQRQIDDLGMRVADDTSCRVPLVRATGARLFQIDSRKLKSKLPDSSSNRLD
jgi:hypothetical protein